MIISSFRAMGTTCEVRAERHDVMKEVQQRFRRYEQRFSRFLPDSELSTLNRVADVWQTVSPEMAAVLGVATDARRRTGGLVDIGIGATLAGWGYDRPIDTMAEGIKAPTTTSKHGWIFARDRVRIDVGTALDLGGIVKGWVCDRAVEATEASLVSAGGDMMSTDPDLSVELTDPDGVSYASVELGVGGLATSSRIARTWKTDEGIANHLIDPRDHRPVTSPVLQATVVAASAADAEIGAKAVLLMGSDGLAWADRQPWIRQTIALWHDGSVYATHDSRERQSA